MKIIRIDGIIGDWANTVEEFQFRLSMLELEPDEQLKVIINSQGGNVFHGYGIYNILVALPNTIIVEIEGLAASIATLIAFAAKKENTYISQISMFMIHRASVAANGNAEELEKQADTLKSIDEQLITVYTARTGKTRKQVEDMLSQETWLTAEDAIKEGFFKRANLINTIDAKAVAMALQSQIDSNMEYFKNLANRFSNKGETPAAKTPEQIAAEAAAAKTPEQIAAEAAEAAAEAKTPEQIAAEAAAAAEAAKTPEQIAAAAEAAAAPEKQYVTVEAFQELFDLVKEVVTGLADPKTVEDQVKQSFAAQMKALPGSGGQPRAGQTNLGQKNGDVYVPPNANFRKRMKDIEQKTRLS